MWSGVSQRAPGLARLLEQAQGDAARLDVACQERDLGLPSLKTDILLDYLRTGLRLTELVKRVGLP